MHALVWYFLITTIVSLPAILAARQTAETTRDRLLEGAIVAVAWPITVPALLVGSVARRAHVSTSR